MISAMKKYLLLKLSMGLTAYIEGTPTKFALLQNSLTNTDFFVCVCVLRCFPPVHDTSNTQHHPGEL